METKRICSSCRKPLASNAPQGLCPECLLKAGLGSGVDIGPDTQSGSGRFPFVAPPLEEIARLFPQLEILGLIGQGGMGAVYRARQRELDRVVALKILPPDIGRDTTFGERFTREARAMAKLSHPGIVTLFEFGRADGLFFFLMEFVEGVNLGQLLEGGHLSSREALAIVPQICEALQYAHDQGIIHRDIKPQNILVDRRGKVKVADFGLAKLIGQGDEPGSVAPQGNAGSSLTEAGKVMGTPQYMAPEQREHPTEVDHRADIYSLGVVFYQMLTGELPGKPVQAPSSRPGGVQIDVRLDEVVLHAMEKEPARRYQHASEVKSDVESIAADQIPVTPSATPPVPASQRSSQPNIWEAGLIAAGLLVFTTMFAVGLPSLPQPARGLLTFICLFGSAICLLTLAGWWPAPNLGIPDSGFSRRNLHHTRELSLAAILCAGLSGLIPIIFYWLAPWLVPGLTPQGQESMLWLTAFAAMLAILMGLGARRTGLGQSAWVVGLINLSLWVLLAVAGNFSADAPPSRASADQTSHFGPASVASPTTSPAPATATGGRADDLIGASTPERKFVRLVAEQTALTFEGQPTSWDEVGVLLSAVPRREKTVLEFAVTSDQITVAQQNEWFGKATALARQHGFEYASFIGIHPLGSKGTGMSSADAEDSPGQPFFEVVALTSTPREGMTWWSPDGTLLKQLPGDRIAELSGFCRGEKARIEFAVVIKDSREPGSGRDFLPLFDPRPQSVSRHELFKGEQSAGQVTLVGFRSAPPELTCRMAAADGTWQRVATWDKAGNLLSNETGGRVQLVRSGDTNTTCLRLSHQVAPDRFAVRLIARLSDGQHKLASICRTDYGDKDESQLCALIEGWNEQNVVAYELYRVGLRWTAVPRIATKPNVPPLPALPGEGFINQAPGPAQLRSSTAASSQKPSGPQLLAELPHRTNDILRIKLRHAEEAAARAETQFKVGRMSQSELQAARDEVLILNAELSGDAIRVAQARLAAAERQLAFAKVRFEAGVVSDSEYRAARNAVELRQAELRAINANSLSPTPPQGSNPGPVPPAAAISNLIASENWAEMMKLFPQAVRRTDKANAVEGDIRIDTPTLLEWDMSLPMAFVTGMEKRPMPEFKPGCWLEFPPSRDRVVIHLRYDPWPHAAWRFRLEMLDGDGGTIQQLDHTLENTGRRPPKRQWTVEPSEFSGAIGRGVLDRCKRFRLSIESLWIEQDGEFRPNVELPLYFGLSTIDYTGMLRAEWLKVSSTNAEALVHARVAQWPKSKWSLRLQLFDSQGRSAGEGSGVAENGGWIVSRVATGEQDFQFPVKNVPDDTRSPQQFRLRIEPVPDTSETPGQAADSSSK